MYGLLNDASFQVVTLIDRLDRLARVVQHLQRLVELWQPEHNPLQSVAVDPSLACPTEKVRRLRSGCIIKSAAENQNGVGRSEVLLQVCPCHCFVDALGVHNGHVDIPAARDQRRIDEYVNPSGYRELRVIARVDAVEFGPQPLEVAHAPAFVPPHVPTLTPVGTHSGENLELEPQRYFLFTPAALQFFGSNLFRQLQCGIGRPRSAKSTSAWPPEIRHVADRTLYLPRHNLVVLRTASITTHSRCVQNFVREIRHMGSYLFVRAGFDHDTWRSGSNEYLAQRGPSPPHIQHRSRSSCLWLGDDQIRDVTNRRRLSHADLAYEDQIALAFQQLSGCGCDLVA